MAKPVAAVVKIQIPAGQATPAPPVGTALGPHGVAIMDFCKQYNEQTSERAGQIIPVVITIEAGLSFLGLGVKPPTPSWGSILNDGFGFIRNTPWLVVAGGIPLIVTTLGFTFLGEALRDVFDPKLKKDR